MENPIKMDDLRVPLFSETSKCRVGRRSFPFGFRPGKLGVSFREGIEHPNGLRTSEWLRAKIWAICFQLVPDFFLLETPLVFCFCSMNKAN